MTDALEPPAPSSQAPIILAVPQRGAGLTDWLTVVATMLAAVAATAAVFVAIRQEQAMFTSQLYNQQIERVGPLVAAAQDESSSLERDIGTLKKFGDQLRSAPISQRSILMDQYAASQKELQAHVDVFAVGTNQAALILPPKFDPLIQDIVTASSTYRKEFDVPDAPLCGENSEGDANCWEDAKEGMEAARREYADHMSAAVTLLYACARKALYETGTLTNDSVAGCDLKPPQATHPG